MPEDEYDISGFAAGIAVMKDIIDGKDIKEGDVLIGLASSGVHSNGFSLIRKVFSMKEENLNRYFDSLGKSLGDALLEPTKIYTKALKSIKDANVRIKGCSHITGGGFYENIPRMLSEGIRAVIEKASYPKPAIFDLIQTEGRIEEHMMYNTYNMGLGMVLAVDQADVDTVRKAVKDAGEEAFVTGKTVSGERGVDIC